MQPVQDINIGGRLTATQYQYTLTDVDFTELNRWAPIVQNALAKLPQIIDLTSDQQSAAPQVTLAINRDVASRLGITAATSTGCCTMPSGSGRYRSSSPASISTSSSWR